MLNMMGKGNQLFAEQIPGADPTKFQIDNTSVQYYNSPYYLQHKDQLQPVPKPSIDQPRMRLADVLKSSDIRKIQHARQISFHTVGDSGAAIPAHLMKKVGCGCDGR